MAYIKADDVRSPKASWSLIEVLADNGPSNNAVGAWSLAIGEWEGERRLAVRWNGHDGPTGSPAGNPQSRGIATWFILPPEFEEHLRAIIPVEKRAIASALLPPKTLKV